VQTKAGTLTEEELTTQDNHLALVSNSKSSQEWLLTELSSGTSILVDTNSDSESETTTQLATSNGGPSIPEPTPSEPGPRETMLLPTKEELDSELESPLLFFSTPVITLRKSNGTVDLEETSETTEVSASMFTVTLTLTTDTSSTGTATTV
jgi:hypothetical protein